MLTERALRLRRHGTAPPLFTPPLTGTFIATRAPGAACQTVGSIDASAAVCPGAALPGVGSAERITSTVTPARPFQLAARFTFQRYRGIRHE